MGEQMKILLKSDRKEEADEMLRLLEELSDEEQRDLLVFMQGVRLGREMAGMRGGRRENVV